MRVAFYYYSMSILFFFFQAEDGIRDWSVTGVQTCALPISTAACRGCRGDRRQPRQAAVDRRSARWDDELPPRSAAFLRSEERREGKSVDIGSRRRMKTKTG